MRLFFALACPPPVTEQIVEWRSALALDGSPVSAANLHVTLAFVGQQAEQRLATLLDLAASIEAQPFTLQLDQLCLWPEGLLHLAASHPPTALLKLASDLQHKLRSSGFELEQREYLPHLTLARHSRQPAKVAPPAFAWNVNQFSLFVSLPEPAGVRYTALASWRLHRAP
mgnify:FL=1